MFSLKPKHKKDVLYILVILVISIISGQYYYEQKQIPSEPRQVEVYYNKQTEANRLLIETVQDADSYVYFAIYTFTRTDIKDALLGAKYRGLDVRGVIDKEQTQRIDEQKQIVKELREYNIPIYEQDHTSIMHLKTLVTDKHFFSGSYNWTTSGTKFNDEIITIGTDADLKNKYQKVIQELFNRYGPRS